MKDKIKKNSFNYIKGFKKIKIKRMMIKIEIQNKFYIWMKGEIKKKNQFSKRTQTNKKNEDQNWHKKIKIIFWLKGVLKKNNNFYKRAKKNKLKIKTIRTELENIIPSI